MKFVEPWAEALDELRAAGWHRVESGDWRDPATDRDYPVWRAIELCRKDAAAVRERGAA